MISVSNMQAYTSYASEQWFLQIRLQVAIMSNTFICIVSIHGALAIYCLTIFYGWQNNGLAMQELRNTIPGFSLAGFRKPDPVVCMASLI